MVAAAAAAATTRATTAATKDDPNDEDAGSAAAATTAVVAATGPTAAAALAATTGSPYQQQQQQHLQIVADAEAEAARVAKILVNPKDLPTLDQPSTDALPHLDHAWNMIELCSMHSAEVSMTYQQLGLSAEALEDLLGPI